MSGIGRSQSRLGVSSPPRIPSLQCNLGYSSGGEPSNRHDHGRWGVSCRSRGDVAVHGKRAAHDPKQEVAIAGQFARKHDDGGNVADEEDPFVLPAKAPLYLRDQHGQKAPGAVVYGNEALTQARWVPH